MTHFPLSDFDKCKFCKACFCKLFAYNPSNNTKRPSVLLFNKKYLNHPVWILRTGIPSIINHLKWRQVRLTRFNQNFYCFLVLVLVFLNYTSGYLKFFIFFSFLKCHGKGLFKNVHFIIFWTSFFFAIFLFYNWILQKKSIFFSNLQIIFSDSKSRA